MRKFFGLLSLLALGTGLGFGQAISVNGGSIQGTITDATGAVVPNASIVITGTDTGFTKTISADSSGFYSVGPLNPGNYTVDVTAAGFQKLDVKTVVRTGTVTSGNFKLPVGQSNETVEVNAGALQVNTEQAGVSDVITREQINSLPVNGRNFLDLAQIEPGVILQSGESFDPTKAGYSAISVSGVSGRTTRILLDGQDISDENVGTTIFNVSQGSIGDFQLNRSTQDVSGEVTSTGQVLVSTNSGTNSVHGQLFYNFQDHRAGFARTAGGIDVPFQRNQFGGSVGGPIIKDKLFFFGNSERIKQDQSNSVTLNPIFQSIQTQYPSLPSPFRETYSVVRLDYNGPKGIHFFARANYDVNSSSSNFGAGYELYTNRDNTPGLAGGADFSTGRFTHSFRGSYEKFHNLIGDFTVGNSSVYNGIPGLNFRYRAGAGLYSGPNVDAPQQTYQSDKQFRYDGTWTRGSHSIRYGYSINRILGGGFAAFFALAPRATISSSTLLANCGGVAGTAPCASDPVNGYRVSGVRLGNGLGFSTEIPQFNLPGGGLQDWREGAYVSDSWKIKPYFTLTAGVRWSVDTDRANQDLATPLCSDVAPTLQFAGCTGNTPLFDQYQAGLGKKVRQPYGNFGPQIGFTFSPGDHKTVLRAGVGIFYEGDVFNNTLNSRPGLLKSGLFVDYNQVVCGGVNTVVLPNGNKIATVDGTATGTPIASICGLPLAQSGPQFVTLQQTYQAAVKALGPSTNGNYVGNTLNVNGLYGAPYRTPYSEQINAGVQRELFKGAILSVDYVHNATIKLSQYVDVNHVGAARTLNTTAAQAAIATTTSSFNCAGGSSQAAVTCAIAAGASIIDFAGKGLDSGQAYLSGNSASYYGLTPATGAAFPGLNPNVGQGNFILPVGRSGYDALQVVFRQQKTHPVPGIESSNLQVSYSLSRIVSTANTTGGDQFFSTLSYDNDNPTRYIGRNGLDHTHEISAGGSFVLKYGPRLGLVGHYYSPSPITLALDASGTSGSAVGGIFQSDITGDGTIGDVAPNTNPGDYMHRINGKNIGSYVDSYNATQAGRITPAGQALVSAGLLTPSQLSGLQAVQQPLAPLPQAQGFENRGFQSADVTFSYPIRMNRFHEGLSLEPAVAFYNVGNFANFTPSTTGTLSNTTSGPVSGSPTGPTSTGGVSAFEQFRVQRGAGALDIGGPRSTEFQLRLNF